MKQRLLLHEDHDLLTLTLGSGPHVIWSCPFIVRVRLHPQLHHLSAQLALFLTEPHHAHSWRSRTNEDEIKRRCREHWKDLYRDGPSLGSPRRPQPAEHLLLLSLARRQDRRQQPLLRIQLAGILRRASSSFQRASPRSLRSPRSRTTSPFFLCSTSRWTRLPGSLVRELYPAKGPPDGLSRRGSDRSSRQFSARRRLFEAPEFTPGREALYINARIFGLWGESPFLIGTRERSRPGPRVLEGEEVRHLMVGIWPRCRGSSSTAIFSPYNILIDHERNLRLGSSTSPLRDSSLTATRPGRSAARDTAATSVSR